MNKNIFKAYDIRGIYKEDFDETTAYNLGVAYANLRKKEEGREDLQIVVAKDMRISSPSLHKNLINGLLDAGVDVIDIGLASTPTFYFAIANFNYDGGIIVSASHNPSEYNGFKITRKKAIPVSGETGIMDLRDKIIAGDLPLSEQKGKLSNKENILEQQIDYALKFANITKIKPFKVVVDPANAMGILYIEELFKHLPCTLIKMNFKLDGTFPNHEADPLKEENQFDLQKKVISENADLGISIDGDGDRIFFVDNRGKSIEQSIVRGILSQIFLKDKAGAKIGYDIRPGKITEDLIREAGGIPIVTRVGHSLIKEQVLSENIYFAGESSGHFFLNMEIGCFEVPMIVALKLLQEFSESGKTVAEYTAPFYKYFHSGEINTMVSDKEDVFSALKNKYANANSINELDGVTINYDNFWFNVRGSNTEPKIRLNLEAISSEIMEEKRDEILRVISKFKI